MTFWIDLGKRAIGVLVICVLVAYVVVFLNALKEKDDKPADTETKVFGLDKVIAFYGEPRDIESANFVLSDDWKFWKERGGVAAISRTWFPVLQNTIDKGSDVLVNLNYGDNPNPVVSIDEFGFDFDGQIDIKTAEILKATKKKKPELNIAIWQMRGPVAPRLAETYRELVDLVLLETYVNLDNSWIIAFQLQAARLNGLLEKSIIDLGLGQESPQLGGWAWIRTKEELEQQIRLIRFIAPESPGVAFFGYGNLAKHPLTPKDIDEVCSRFLEVPADGTGLRPDLQELSKAFTKQYEKPAIFCSSLLAYPNYYPGHPGPEGEWTDWGRLVRPMIFRALMMNLGKQDAKKIKVSLQNRGESGEIWAEGTLDIPARSVKVAELPVLPGKEMREWVGSWIMSVEAPDCEVFVFRDARLWK